MSLSLGQNRLAMLYNYAQRIFAYTAYRGQKFFRKTPAPLINFASETIMHEPAQEGYYPPPVTLEGQIGRVTGNWWVPLDEVIKNTIQTHQSHSATILHKLNNITIDNGFLYKGTKAEYLSSLGIPDPLQPVKKEEGLLCSTSSGAVYFGDWMIADNLLEEISKELGINPIKVMPHTKYSHLPDINKIMHLSTNYINKPTYFDNLYVPDDSGYNTNKVNRLKNLRTLFTQSSYINSENKKNIYLLRNVKNDARGLSNEQELTDYLETCGFKIINPSQMSVDEIAAEVIDSDLIIGVEGSQLGYGSLGLKEGGLMIALQPPYHFQSSWRPRCEAVDVHWGFLVGFQNEKGFEIPLDDLKRLLEKVC